MSEITSFRVAFFSDSSNNSYTDNKPNNFRVKLTHPIDLTDKWEVALTDLHMVNSKYGIRAGKNEVVVYRITGKHKPSPKDALNKPKNTFLMPNLSSVAEVVKYLNQVTQKYTVSRIAKNNFPHGVSTKKRGIVFKYEERKVKIHLNFGYGIHLGSDICQVLGIKNENIIPNKLGHVVMREDLQYETVPILNEQINENPKESTIFVCTDLIKNQYFESKTLPILKAVICGSEEENLKEYDCYFLRVGKKPFRKHKY